jgi:hypothetical protein
MKKPDFKLPSGSSTRDPVREIDDLYGHFGSLREEVDQYIRAVDEKISKPGLRGGFEVDDVRSYGTIQNAVTAVPSSSSKTIFITTTQFIASSLTIPSNISVVVLKGGSFNIASSQTLTFNGAFTAGRFQVFSGAGSDTGVSFHGSSVEAVDPVWWGALCHAVKVTDAAISSSSTTLTSASNLFTSAHVGAQVYVAGAGSGGAILSTTISAYVGAGQVTLATAASTTVSGAQAAWGHDDSTEFHSAVRSGRPVRFRGDSLFSSTLTITTKAKIFSDGKSTIYTGGVSEVIALNTGSDESEMSGFNLESVYNASHSTFGVAMQAVEKIFLSRMRFKYYNLGVYQTMSASSQAKYLRIKDCYFDGCGNGIKLIGSQFFQILNNQFRYDTQMNVAILIGHGEDGVIQGNVIEGSAASSRNAIMIQHQRDRGYRHSKNITVIGNKVAGIKEEAITLDTGGPVSSYGGVDWSSAQAFDGFNAGTRVVTKNTGGGFTGFNTNDLADGFVRLYDLANNIVESHIPIASNTSTTITLRRDPATVFDPANHKIQLFSAWLYKDGGQATSGSTTSLTMTGANWTSNQWTNYHVTVHDGTGAGQYAAITSNTADTLSFDALQVAFDNTSVFSITALATGIQYIGNHVRNSGRAGLMMYGGHMNCAIIGNTVEDCITESADAAWRGMIESNATQQTKFGDYEVCPGYYTTISGNTIVSKTNQRNGIYVGVFRSPGTGLFGGFGYNIQGNTITGRIDKGIKLSAVQRSVVSGNTITGASVPISEPTSEYNSLNQIFDNIISNSATQSYAGTSTVGRMVGSGSPEGVVTAPVGFLYIRYDGSGNALLYIKGSGTGNTGWVSTVNIDSAGAASFVALTLSGLLTASGGMVIGNSNSAYQTLGTPSLYGTNGAGSGPFADVGNLVIAARGNADRDILFQSRVSSTAVQAGRVQGGSGGLEWSYPVTLLSTLSIGNGTAIDKYEEGTFTGTLTGVTTTVTGTLHYTRIGKIVTLYIPPLTGTSNTTLCRITGLPASIVPASGRTHNIVAEGITDNGTEYAGIISVNEVAGAGQLELLFRTAANVAATPTFTNSGTKGLALEATITYTIQ